MARLIVDLDGEKKTYDLAAGASLTIGRDPTSGVPLPDGKGASRKHCEVRPAAGGGWEVADLGATNKTRVNGAAVDSRVLASGDTVEVGKVSIRFEDPEEEARLAAAGKQGVCLLEYADGTRKGQRVMLTGPRTTLGRRAGNTIVLEDRMASGHHAEIVKDLNGYTIRDLGSTNGILVNGNSTTESPLAHGMRLRVGGTRFIFRDPSMKEVEAELATIDDEDGWGMMGDIDLSKARVSRGGTISTIVFLALVGAGGFFLMRGAETGGGAAQGPTGEQVRNGSFERAELPWSWADGGSLSAGRVTGPQGGALEARNEQAEGARPGEVVYDEEILASAGRQLRVKARLRGQGELLALWRNDADRAAGATGVVHAQVLGTGATGSVDRALAFPSWATALTLKLVVPVGGRLALDDLSVRATPGLPATIPLDVPGLPSVTVEADGSATLQVNRTLLAAPLGATAWKGNERLAFTATGEPARQGDTVRVAGRFAGSAGELEGSVTWSAGPEGLLAEVACAGADAVGLSAELPRAHLGGALNVLTASDARGVSLGMGPVDGDLRKTLAGNPKADGARPPTLLAFQPAEGTARLSVEDPHDAGMVRVLHAIQGASGRLSVVTEFGAQAEAARVALEQARQLARTSPGSAIGALRQVAQANPFQAGVAEEAANLARQLEEKLTADIAALRASVRTFALLGSPAALQEMRAREATVRASFPAGSAPAVADGSFASQVEQLTAQARALERDDALATLGPRSERLERLATSLATTKGYEAMALLIFRDLQASLAPLVSGTTEGDALLARLSSSVQAIESTPGVADALPPR